MTHKSIAHPATIQSFNRRSGRMTSAQKKAWDTLYPPHIASLQRPVAPGTWHPHTSFDSMAPVMLDIGFGHGGSLVAYAQQHPDWNCLGVDVHKPGIGHVLHTITACDIRNVRVICEDVVSCLHIMQPNSLDRIHVFFPDPWPKTRHHKRRLIQAAFLAQLARVLRPQGVLHIITDWLDYALHIERQLQATPQWHIVDPHHPSSWPQRPRTRFEAKGLHQEHEITEWLCVCAP